ncbi:MAG: hypothetical protein NVS2B1_04260 [Bradyrhizobium sp.]
MSDNEPVQAADEDIVADAAAPCVALVPVVQTVRWSPVADPLVSRADFLTQLIATAEHAPQTRSLRRGTPADAKTAYSARRPQAPGAGLRTRQII